MENQNLIVVPISELEKKKDQRVGSFKAITLRCMQPLVITKVLMTLLLSGGSEDHFKGKMQFKKLEIEANTTEPSEI